MYYGGVARLFLFSIHLVLWEKQEEGCGNLHSTQSNLSSDLCILISFPIIHKVIRHALAEQHIQREFCHTPPQSDSRHLNSQYLILRINILRQISISQYQYLIFFCSNYPSTHAHGQNQVNLSFECQ